MPFNDIKITIMFEQAIQKYLKEKGYDKINLKAVLFDMDGVLFDSMKNHAKAWNKAMSMYGMTCTKDVPEPAQ